MAVMHKKQRKRREQDLIKRSVMGESSSGGRTVEAVTSPSFSQSMVINETPAARTERVTMDLPVDHQSIKI